MYILEHALLNLGKNKGRNILLGIMIFAIITSAVVALAIFNATDVMIEDTKTALQCAVRISSRIQTSASGQKQHIIGGDQPQTILSIEQYRSFAASEYLDGADIKEGGRSPDGVDAVYYLKTPGMLSDFENELRDKGLPEEYHAETDESSLERMVEPVNRLKNLSISFLIIILVLGAVIMILLSMISVRERKYEIGVLRAMGMKKKKIALGLWIEIMIITCICFGLGMGVGIAISQPVSDSMMADQLQSSAPKTSTLADRLNEEEAESVENIRISLDGITTLEILGISLLLASIAGMISVSQITKYEPIKILMKRN